MIQPIRAAHCDAFIALAILLPAVLVIGLNVRHPRVCSKSRVVQLDDSAHLVRKSGTLWPKHRIETEFREDSNDLGKVSIILHASEEPSDPDLLLYWSHERPIGALLPASARLIGPFVADDSLPLPLDVERAGYLVLFSLPHHTVVDTARVEKLP